MKNPTETGTGAGTEAAMRSRWLCGLLALWGLGCGAVDATEPTPVADDCTLVSVNSDYTSTSISIHRPDGTLCREGVLHSGSAAPGVVTALSGDVVTVSNRHPDGQLVLLDRFPNGVLTVWDPRRGQVTRQVSVASGFAANPQDALFLDRSRVLVSRLETNKNPGRTPFDGGDDLIQVNLESGAITARLGLTSEADAGLLARPQRLSAQGGRVYVSLTNLAADFKTAGPGRLLGVKPETLEVVDRVDFPALRGCNTHTPSPTSGRLWVVCSGIFAQGTETQIETSGLAVVDTQPALSVVWSRSATALGLSRPLAFGVAPESDMVAWVITFGDADTLSDALWRIDRSKAPVQVTQIPLAAAGFELGQPVISPEAGLLLVPDANPKAPRLQRFDLTSQAAQSPTVASPSSGLPPRHLSFFR